MSLIGRAMKSMRHHHITTSMLFIYNFLFLSCFLLLGCFMLYLLTSTEQLASSVETIKEYDTSLYAKPFEELVSKITHLFSTIQPLFLLLIFIGVISIICVQLLLFHFRKQEYRSYLLLNEPSSKLCCQITLEQLMVLNAVLVSLFILYIFFQSQLFGFLSRIENSILVDHTAQTEVMTIQSTPEPNSIINGHGFTRFHIRPFLVSSKNEHLFTLAVRHQFPIIALFLNAISFCLIYLSNYVIFYVTTKKRF